MKNKSIDGHLLVSSAVDGLERVKAENITVLDFKEIKNTAFNYFIIAEGTSNIHVKGIADSVEEKIFEKLKKHPYGVEGKECLKWVLIDYVDVIVHVFQKSVRQHYNIENLWGDAVSIKLK